MGSPQSDADRMELEAKYDELLEILGNSAEEQEKILEHILSANAETEYLRQYGLNGATDAKTFREKVPVSDYDDYKPYVDRLFQGDKSPLLTASPVTQLWTSSGTSKGTPKMFAGTDEELMHRARVMNYQEAVVIRALPEVQNCSKCLAFYSIRKSTFSPGGLPCHPMTTAMFTTSASLKYNENRSKVVMTSPPQVLLAEDHDEIIYCHLLLGLVQREEVDSIAAMFPPTLLRAIRSLQQWWPQICEDIAAGSLSKHHVKDEKLRSAVQSGLKKLPNLAEQLKKEFSVGDSWTGIMQRLWPNAKVVSCSCSGTMEPYYPVVTDYAGNIPVMSTMMYVSTEGSHGINMNPRSPGNEVCYNLFPATVYYEFIAVGDEGSDPEVLDLVSLSEGKEYEILITAFSGLCRYRLGDVVKVVGHYKSNPTVHLVRRASEVLSVDMDKTDEVELHSAVADGSQHLRKELGSTLVDYTSTTDYQSRPGHYVIFWELDPAATESWLAGKDSKSLKQQQVLEACCAKMEAAFGRIYRRGRQEGMVGALQLLLVQQGTFNQLCNEASSRGASESQFKTPRGLASQSPLLKVMMDNVIYSAVSQTKPLL